MIKKLHIIDYFIILLFVFLAAVFVNKVNTEFSSNNKETLFPASITVLVKDRIEVLNSIHVNDILSEDKKFEKVSIISKNFVTSTSDNLYEGKIVLAVNLTYDSHNYYLDNKEVKIGKSFILETESLFLESTIVQFELGVTHE